MRQSNVQIIQEREVGLVLSKRSPGSNSAVPSPQKERVNRQLPSTLTKQKDPIEPHTPKKNKCPFDNKFSKTVTWDRREEARIFFKLKASNQRHSRFSLMKDKLLTYTALFETTKRVFELIILLFGFRNSRLCRFRLLRTSPDHTHGLDSEVVHRHVPNAHCRPRSFPCHHVLLRIG